jgi:DNA-binding MarR family transcriptional regulator
MENCAGLDQAEVLASLLLVLMRHLAMPDDGLAAKLPLAQLRVCAILVGGPRPMSALSRELGVSLSAMTQIADRLEKARLVRRIPQAADRRIRCLQLTPRGEKMIRQRQDARLQRVRRLLDQLSLQAREEVVAAFETLAQACEEIQAETPPVETAGPTARAIL